MDRYRKLKVIGKGSFGYAVQVQSVADRHTYVMKVQIKAEAFYLVELLTQSFCCLDYRRLQNGQKAARGCHQ